MRNIIRQALRDIVQLLGEDSLVNPTKFKAGMLDVLPGSSHELIRNLLNCAIGGMDVYMRLINSSSGNIRTNVYNLVKEMSQKHGISEDLAQMVIECIAELFGYSSTTDVDNSLSKQSYDMKSLSKATMQSIPPFNSHDGFSITVTSLYDGGLVNLEFMEWEEACDRFNDVLKVDPRNAPAYIGKLCAELKIQKIDELVEHNKPLTEYMNFNKAVSFATPDYRKILENYNQIINDSVHLKELQQRKQKSKERNESLMRKVGSIVMFGSYEWRVLDVKHGKALLLSNKIVDTMPYNHGNNTTNSWKQCSLRQYLNNVFLNSFIQADRNRIALTRVTNPKNLWYDINGGADTADKIYLLSVEEVDRYFGNSGDYFNKRRKANENRKFHANRNGYYLSNLYDINRVVTGATMWWLRSPGLNSDRVTCVISNNGAIFVKGIGFNAKGGVRPALWINL